MQTSWMVSSTESESAVTNPEIVRIGLRFLLIDISAMNLDFKEALFSGVNHE